MYITMHGSENVKDEDCSQVRNSIWCQSYECVTVGVLSRYAILTCTGTVSFFYSSTSSGINPKNITNRIDPYPVVVVIVVTARSSPSFQTVSAGSTSDRSGR
jgi:hypothetical protein